MDAIQFEELFTSHYIPPGRTPELGHFKMVYGIIMLLYIGFNGYGIFYTYGLTR